MRPVIEVNNLSKQYRLGLKEFQAETFLGALRKFVVSPLSNYRRIRNLGREGKETENIFWALKDINFAVEAGEVIGIIGRNGAGKSTLLKILSRITDPTRGSVKITGRIASLLEVGTGFHPELSGRENVFLNGTILGMKRWEITNKFDEIVEFSGVEKFIDTPVKFYSSGMKVRLGFAVAAHLNPEILIIDEVLAVGDAEFQKRCLGKMDEVSKNEGRTILFVSHNMAAIKSLCNVGLFLKEGQVEYFKKDIHNVVRKYYESSALSDQPKPIDKRKDRTGDGTVRVTCLELINSLQDTQIELGSQIGFVVKYTATHESFNGKILLSINTFNGECILFMDSSTISGFPNYIKREGEIGIQLSSDFALPVGRYFVNIAFYANGLLADYVQSAILINVVDGLFFVGGKVPVGKALCYVKQEWTYNEKSYASGSK